MLYAITYWHPVTCELCAVITKPLLFPAFGWMYTISRNGAEKFNWAENTRKSSTSCWQIQVKIQASHVQFENISQQHNRTWWKESVRQPLQSMCDIGICRGCSILLAFFKVVIWLQYSFVHFSHNGFYLSFHENPLCSYFKWTIGPTSSTFLEPSISLSTSINGRVERLVLSSFPNCNSSNCKGSE